MLTLQSLTYIERLSRTRRTICNYASGTLTPSKGPDSMLNRIALIISTAEKCASIQVVKQTEYEKASTTEEQKFPPFRRTVINN